jgi:hypothetical protein
MIMMVRRLSELEPLFSVSIRDVTLAPCRRRPVSDVRVRGDHQGDRA